MKPKIRDLSIFKKFGFERPPVGVKFSTGKPEGIDRLTKRLRICEMLPEAHKGDAFYAILEDFKCVGPLYLGMQDDPVFDLGSIGPKLGMYEEKRANQKLYRTIARLPYNSSKYITFAPLDKINFNPDVFICTGNVDQADILLRASTYMTGDIMIGRTSNGVGCNFVYVYPFISGEVNYVVSGLGFGYFGLPEGLIIISIPYNVLPNVIASLEEMNWPAIYKQITPEELEAKVDKIHMDAAEELNQKAS